MALGRTDSSMCRENTSGWCRIPPTAAVVLAVALGVIAAPATLTGKAQEARSSDAATQKRQRSEGLDFAHGLLRERRFDLAAQEYQRFLDTGPSGRDADDARFGLANAWLFQGRYREARQAFREFLEKAPGHPRARTAQYRLGELAYMLGDLRAARLSLEAFTGESGRHPNLETAWTYLGDVRLGLGDLPGAEASYERSLADYPHGQLADRARFGLGRTLAEMGAAGPAAKILNELARGGAADWVDRAWLELGKTQVAAGQYQAAVAALEELERAAPRSPFQGEGRLLRAEALARLDRIPDAEKLLKALIEGGAETLAPRAALALATLEVDHGHPDLALATADDAVKRFPQSPLVPALVFRSAEALLQQKQPDPARERFLRVARSYPEDPWADDALCRAAALALDAGDAAAALTLARQFGKQHATSKLAAEVRLIEARALLAGGQAREAADQLEGLLGLGRESGPRGKSPAAELAPAAEAKARYDLALAYRATGRASQADALLAKLATASATGAVGVDARFLLGQEAVEQGRYSEAVEPLRLYLKSNPQGEVADAALAHLATAEVGLRQLDLASDAVTRLAREFPASRLLPEARLRVAEALLRAGQYPRAAEFFRQIISPGATGSPQPAPASRGEPPDAARDRALVNRARLGLGRTFRRLGKPADAATLFGQYLDHAGAGPEALAVALEQGVALEAAGSTDSALEAYSRLIRQHADAVEALRARLAMARLLDRTGRSERAAQSFQEVLSADAQRAKLKGLGETPDGLLAERGWALVRARKPAEADAAFAELLRSYADSPHAIDARFNLAESASAAGHPDEAIRLLTPVVENAAAPANARNGAQGKPAGKRNAGDAGAGSASAGMMPLILYRLGRSQIETGDWKGAAVMLDRLIRDYPGSSRLREARLLRAEAALHLEDWTCAEAVLAALQSEPPGASESTGFGRLVRARHVQSLLGTRHWQQALAEAKQLAAELPAGDPAIAELDFARGRALLGLAHPQEARQAFQAVIDARKGGDLAAQAHLLRGETFFHEDRLRKALTEFLKVDILYDAPRWQAAALLEAGKVYERLSQWSDAAEAYERLQSRFQGDPHAPEAASRLTTVRKHQADRGRPPG